MIILVLADRFSPATLIAGQLRADGQEVLGPVGTILEMIQVAEKKPPHLALIDIHLRSANCMEAASLLFERWRCMPLFVNRGLDRGGRSVVWGRLGPLGVATTGLNGYPLELGTQALNPRPDEVATKSQRDVHEVQQRYIEEITSLGEELQEANEELEASKEELIAVNEELAAKVAELERTADDLSNLLHSSRMMTVFLDRQLRVRWFTPGACHLIPLLPEDIGRPIQTFALRCRDPDMVRDAGTVLAVAAPAECDVPDEAGSWYLRRVLPYRTSNGQIDGVVLTFDDITERKHSEERIRRLAYYDDVTGLPNRVLLRDRLDRVMRLARREGRGAALVLLDLDDFKTVNDTLGHPSGDLLLRMIAARLGQTIRSSDTLARLGGDEFAIVQMGVRSPPDAANLASKLLQALDDPLHLGEHDVHVTASAGIAMFPQDGSSPDELVKNADLALYRAKAAGRGRYAFFEPLLDREARARERLGRELRAGLDREEFILYYQPQIELCSGRITGAEALVRWQHPERGLVLPDEFIKAAETNGLIRSLGEWILGEGCRQAKAWASLGTPLTVGINISPAQLRHIEARGVIEQTLCNYGFEQSRVELEITEGLLAERDAGKFLRELAEVGIRLAVDDFGTGYSSLAYLKQLPVHRIKIDQSFVHGIGRDTEDEAIVAAIVTLAHRLNKRVVAEGVETETQLCFLRELGCDEAQGFLLGRPQPARLLDGLLAESAAKSRRRRRQQAIRIAAKP